MVEKKFCSGCTACINICPVDCISMEKGLDGFLYPKPDNLKCIKCKKCEHVCPQLKKIRFQDQQEFFAAYNLDLSVREKSTSGGIFYLIAKNFIERGGIVYGAAYMEDFDVSHICVESLDGLKRLQGAKYVQSTLGKIYTDVKKRLLEDRLVLFTGTPCQIAGLSSFLETEYDNLYTIDLVCHGVPSADTWHKYIKYRKDEDKQKEQAVDINMRSKQSGWSHYNYSIVFHYKNEKSYIAKSADDPYMRAYVSNLIIRPACSNCRYKGSQRLSDLTLGDFWGIWSSHPEMDDNRGTSLIITNTEKGTRLLDILSGTCRIQHVDKEEAIKENPSFSIASSYNELSKEVLLRLNKESFSIITAYLPECKLSNKLSLKEVVYDIWIKIRGNT